MRIARRERVPRVEEKEGRISEGGVEKEQDEEGSTTRGRRGKRVVYRVRGGARYHEP
jgi:hypothetical protein